MKKVYDIAVIGESMAGKSTWIASLLKENASKELRRISLDNFEGQTKVPTRYYLEDSLKDILAIRKVEWCIESLLEYLSNKSCAGPLEKYFQFPDGEEALVEYIQGEEYKSCISRLDAAAFLEEIVNNTEICDKGIISYVEILCAAREDVCEVMREYDLDGLIIRDTRGFLDESKEKMRKYLEYFDKEHSDGGGVERVNAQEAENREKLYLQKLLDDRGLYDLDACIFMNIAGSNALNKKSNREIYGPLLEDMLKKHPVFMVVRESLLTKMLCEGHPYQEAMECLKKDEFYTGFDAPRKLLKDFGLFGDKRDYRTEIAQKHYSELALADIQKKTGTSMRIFIKKVLWKF